MNSRFYFFILILVTLSSCKMIQKKELSSYDKCNNGDTESCLYVSSSDPNAETAYKKACDNNLSQGCALLGDIYISKNKNRINEAITLYEKACKAENSYGCNSLKYLCKEGDKSACDLENKDTANTKNIKECSNGNNDACLKLKEYLSTIDKIGVVESLFFEYPTQLTLDKLKENKNEDSSLQGPVYDNLTKMDEISSKFNDKQIELIVRFLLYMDKYTDGALAEELPYTISKIMNNKPLIVVKALAQEKTYLLNSIASSCGEELIDLSKQQARKVAKKIYEKKLKALNTISESSLNNHERKILNQLKQAINKANK